MPSPYIFPCWQDNIHSYMPYTNGQDRQTFSDFYGMHLDPYVSGNVGTVSFWFYIPFNFGSFWFLRSYSRLLPFHFYIIIVQFFN